MWKSPYQWICGHDNSCSASRLIPFAVLTSYARPPRGCTNTRTDKQIVLKVCTIINMSEITHYYASVRRRFTQRGTAPGAMRRDTRRGVTTVFHAVLWNGPIRIVVGQIRHKCAWAVFVHVLLSVPWFGPPFSKIMECIVKMQHNSE